MELSFVYDSAHFAPFAQPADDATRALNRVTVEPRVASFAKEATTALSAAEGKLKRGETMEAVKLYLAASRAFLSAASGVNNEQTALMLIYLSNSITRKIEGLRAQITAGSSTSASEFGRGGTQSAATVPETPPLTEHQGGRLTFEGVRSKLRNIDQVPEAISQPSAVEDMLALERRLAELGLVQGRAPMESVSAVQGYSSGTLGESFYVLGRTTSHADFTPLGSDDFTASKGAAASRKFDIKAPLMRRTVSTEAKPKAMGSVVGAIDPLSLSVYPTKALGDVPDATLAASVNFSVGPNVGNMGYASNENVSRLLHAMDRLSKENEALLKEREAGMRYMEENKQLRRQTQEFKKQYDEKFAKLKRVLHDFAAHYPNQANPANDVHKNEKEKLQRRVVELEKVLKTVLTRIESQKKQIEADRAAMAKKDDLIQRYERVFKEIKDRQRQKRPEEYQRPLHPAGMAPQQHHTAPLQQPPEMKIPSEVGLSPSAASQKVLAYNPPRATQRTAPRPSTSTMASLSSSGIAGQSGKAKMQPPRHRS